jgi:hypothetical protein
VIYGSIDVAKHGGGLPMGATFAKALAGTVGRGTGCAGVFVGTILADIELWCTDCLSPAPSWPREVKVADRGRGVWLVHSASKTLRRTLLLKVYVSSSLHCCLVDATPSFFSLESFALCNVLRKKKHDRREKKGVRGSIVFRKG